MDQAPDQCGRRVERAAAPPLARLHHPLEHPPQHIGRDQVRLPGLVRREGEALEEGIEPLAPDRVGQVGPPAVLERVRLEEPAVQEWDAPEPSWNPAPLRGRPVERAEEERPKQIALQVPPPAETAIDLTREEVRPPGEPALALHEIEKQHSRE